MVIRHRDAGGHLDPLEVAEHAEGLLGSERATAVEAHLSSCAQCRDLAASIASVTTILAEQPHELPMPDGVAARIDAALAAEATARTAPSARQSTDGFWSRLRGRMPVIAAAAASVAVLALIGYTITGDVGGDDAGSASQVTADMAESEEEAAEAPREAPEAAAGGQGTPAQDESAELDAGGESAGTRAEADADDGEQSDVEPYQGAVPARELDALIDELQKVLAGQSAQAEPGADGEPCGTALTEELGGQLLGAAETDRVEPGSILVAIDLGTPDTLTGWVLPDCTAGPADALVNFEVPRP